MMKFSGELFEHLWLKRCPKYPRRVEWVENSRVGKRMKRLRRDENNDSNEKKEKTFVPDELCWEILLRLPIESLLRFKLVSKRWHSLIGQPQFARDHLKHHQDRPVSPVWIARSPSFPFQYIDSSPSFPFQYIDSLDSCERLIDETVSITFYNSCDGIICLHILLLGLILWNPCTNECDGIQAPDFFVARYEKCGFGYDSCNKVYKCVRVPSVDGQHRPDSKVVEVVTVNLSSSSTTTTTNSNKPIWRRIHDKFHMTFFGAAVPFDGGLYCIVFNSGFSIQRFDLTEERFQKVPLPFKPRTARLESFDLGVLGTHLAVFRVNGRLSTDIWIMNKAATPTDTTWIKAYKIPAFPSQTMQFFPKKCYLTQEWQIVIYGDAEEISWGPVMTKQMCVIYNPLTNDFKIDDKAALPEGLLVLHVPSLISPHLNTD